MTRRTKQSVGKDHSPTEEVPATRITIDLAETIETAAHDILYIAISFFSTIAKLTTRPINLFADPENEKASEISALLFLILASTAVATLFLMDTLSGIDLDEVAVTFVFKYVDEIFANLTADRVVILSLPMVLVAYCIGKITFRENTDFGQQRMLDATFYAFGIVSICVLLLLPATWLAMHLYELSKTSLMWTVGECISCSPFILAFALGTRVLATAAGLSRPEITRADYVFYCLRLVVGLLAFFVIAKFIQLARESISAH
jgi:hypothetical protein